MHGALLWRRPEFTPARPGTGEGFVSVASPLPAMRGRRRAALQRVARSCSLTPRPFGLYRCATRERICGWVRWRERTHLRSFVLNNIMGSFRHLNFLLTAGFPALARPAPLRISTAPSRPHRAKRNLLAPARPGNEPASLHQFKYCTLRNRCQAKKPVSAGALRSRASSAEASRLHFVTAAGTAALPCSAGPVRQPCGFSSFSRRADLRLWCSAPL
jgi:hypothetical protein